MFKNIDYGKTEILEGWSFTQACLDPMTVSTPEYHYVTITDNSCKTTIEVAQTDIPKLIQALQLAYKYTEIDSE